MYYRVHFGLAGGGLLSCELLDWEVDLIPDSSNYEIWAKCVIDDFPEDLIIEEYLIENNAGVVLSSGSGRVKSINNSGAVYWVQLTSDNTTSFSLPFSNWKKVGF